jgi:phospholipid/cholesterol/gamma-HCH transport system ATP-binding protein
MPQAELYQLRRRMGMLFQFGALFTDMTVFENVAFPMREHTDMSDEMIRDLVLMKLEAVGLRGAHKLMPGSCPVVWLAEFLLRGRWRLIPCW